MTFRGPPDTEDRLRWLADRRAVVRRHHPDVGGLAGDLEAALAAVDACYAPGPPTPVVGRASEAHGFSARLHLVATHLVRRAHLGSRAVRAALPRGWPGSRRYVEL